MIPLAEVAISAGGTIGAVGRELIPIHAVISINGNCFAGGVVPTFGHLTLPLSLKGPGRWPPGEIDCILRHSVGDLALFYQFLMGGGQCLEFFGIALNPCLRRCRKAG